MHGGGGCFFNPVSPTLTVTEGVCMSCEFKIGCSTQLLVIVVVCSLKEHGGTTGMSTQTSMGCTSNVKASAMVSHGNISVLPHQVGAYVTIQM